MASETEKRLKDVEQEIGYMRESYERLHNRWVDTVKKVTGSDSEPLVAATYMLLHMMAAQPDRAVMKEFVDLNLVKITANDESNNYRPKKTPYRP